MLCAGISVLPANEDEEINFPYTCTIVSTLSNKESISFFCFGEERYIDFTPITIDSTVASVNHGLYINSTSGTSGSKKFCFSNWNKILFNTKAINNVYCISSKDILISLFPAHVHMHESCMRGLLCGGTNILIDSLDIISIANSIYTRKVSQIQGTPNQLLLLKEKLLPNMCESVKIVECCGGSLSIRAESELKSVFTKATIVRAWGSSETTGVCVSTIMSGDNDPYSIGMCIPPYEYALESNKYSGHFNLLIKGEGVMSHIYYGSGLQKIGEWLNTGDLVECDNNGNLHFCGRYSGMIKYAGENIYPEEVENALCMVRGIVDAIVVGAYDDLRGEFPVALVQKEKGVNIQINIIKQKLLEMQLNMNKIPKIIRIVDTPLPYKETGKKDRFLVRTYFNT